MLANKPEWGPPKRQFRLVEKDLCHQAGRVGPCREGNPNPFPRLIVRDQEVIYSELDCNRPRQQRAPRSAVHESEKPRRLRNISIIQT